MSQIPSKRSIAETETPAKVARMEELRAVVDTSLGISFRERRQRHKPVLAAAKTNDSYDDDQLSVLTYDSNTTFGKFSQLQVLSPQGSLASQVAVAPTEDDAFPPTFFPPPRGTKRTDSRPYVFFNQPETPPARETSVPRRTSADHEALARRAMPPHLRHPSREPLRAAQVIDLDSHARQGTPRGLSGSQPIVIDDEDDRHDAMPRPALRDASQQRPSRPERRVTIIEPPARTPPPHPSTPTWIPIPFAQTHRQTSPTPLPTASHSRPPSMPLPNRSPSPVAGPSYSFSTSTVPKITKITKKHTPPPPSPPPVITLDEDDEEDVDDTTRHPPTPIQPANVASTRPTAHLMSFFTPEPSKRIMSDNVIDRTFEKRWIDSMFEGESSVASESVSQLPPPMSVDASLPAPSEDASSVFIYDFGIAAAEKRTVEQKSRHECEPISLESSLPLQSSSEKPEKPMDTSSPPFVLDPYRPPATKKPSAAIDAAIAPAETEADTQPRLEEDDAHNDQQPVRPAAPAHTEITDVFDKFIQKNTMSSPIPATTAAAAQVTVVDTDAEKAADTTPLKGKSKKKEKGKARADTPVAMSTHDDTRASQQHNGHPIDINDDMDAAGFDFDFDDQDNAVLDENDALEGNDDQQDNGNLQDHDVDSVSPSTQPVTH
ncbi:hypothetical protein BC940DRAFT_115428 [Gongronella butleri]|nr:hypothetical protein BC940DRAFT_115428 [Gongronella butleri]